jgi:tetratricopeptide (TPR) repeat protein
MSASLAKKLALTALQTAPNDGFLNLFLGNVFDEAGDVEKALLYYNKAIETNKINHETLARICVLNYQVQNFDSLERMSKIGISLLPSSPDFYYFNAISLLKLKRYDDCIDIAENGLVYTTKNEGKVDLGVIIAEAYFAKKDYQKGKEAYETLIKNNPKDLFLKNNLALILVKHNIELDYADKLINQLSELDPRNQNYQFTKGYILFKKGKYDEAQKFIEPLVNANRKDGSLMNLLGNIFAKKGNIESAVDYWKAAKELGYKNSVLDKKINDKKYYDDVE